MSDYDKGMMDGWNGDEYEIEYTWEELDNMACLEADMHNTEEI